MVTQSMISMFAFGVPQHEEFLHDPSLSGLLVERDSQILCGTELGFAKRNMPTAPLATIDAIRMKAAAKLPLMSVRRPTITGINSPEAEKNVIMIPVAAPVRSR